METTQLIALTLLSGLSMYYFIRRIKRDEKSELEHKMLMDIERTHQVTLFRARMLFEFDTKIMEAMPSYTDMLKSDKPLVASEWVNVDQLVNLN